MNRLLLSLCAMGLIMLLSVSAAYSTDIMSAGAGGTIIRGRWSSPSTWLGGVVPTSSDNVYIADGDTVILDVSAEVVDLSVGMSSGGSVFYFSDSISVVLRVTGNLLVMDNGTFKTRSPQPTAGTLIDTVYAHGDFIVNPGSTLDLRSSSSSVCYLVFLGSGNSTLKSTGPYNSTANEFNGITINKSGTGKVVLGSDIFLASTSSSGTSTQPYLRFIHGLVVTGSYALVTRATVDTMVSGGNDSSYVLGTLGRGMSNGGTGTRFFPVGDADAYRPIRVKNLTPGIVTGHNLRVQVVRGNANPTSSSLTGGIDKVSTVRYYKLTYNKYEATAAASMSFDKFYPSYGKQDGVAEGNSNLRMAWTTGNLTGWSGLGQVVVQDTTVFTDPPAYWHADSLTGGMTLADGQSGYVALARASGTTENTLDFTNTGIARLNDNTPLSFTLAQNYPNPFNPSTTIEFAVPKAGRVVLEVFNLLGQSVARLVDSRLEAGRFTVVFDAHGLSSGVYLYRLEASGTALMKRMVLLK